MVACVDDSSGDEEQILAAILPAAFTQTSQDEGGYLYEPWVQDWPDCHDAGAEPESDADAEEDEAQSDNSDTDQPAQTRIGNTDWCICGQCEATTLEYEVEHVCCSEDKRIKPIIRENGKYLLCNQDCEIRKVYTVHYSTVRQ